MKRKILMSLALAACTLGAIAADVVWHKVDLEARVDGKRVDVEVKADVKGKITKFEVEFGREEYKLSEDELMKFSGCKLDSIKINGEKGALMVMLSKSDQSVVTLTITATGEKSIK
ncbi:MAG: hypothetical protein RR060_01930 [Victivallaceae bacterium]